MTHLFADLMRYRDPVWVALIPALTGPITFLVLLFLRRSATLAGWRLAAAPPIMAAAITTLSVGVFLAAFKSSYPQAEIAFPFRHAAAGVAVSFASSLLAVLIMTVGRRSARNALMAGSLLASGFSCAIFLGVSGAVSPFALSYDLGSVVAVMIAGAALCSFGLWENGLANGRRRVPYATLLITGAMLLVSLGSMASVLSFGDWMNAVMAPDDITSAPIVVIAATEACVVLVLALVGSLIDNRTAARDQQETDRLHQLADATFEAIVIHRDGLVLDGNSNLARLVGTPLADLLGRDLSLFLLSDRTPAHGASDHMVRTEHDVVAFDGRRIPVEMLSRPIAYRSERATITALRDISERRASEARIRFLAHYDALTELPNRALLTETLEQAIWQSRASGEDLAVLGLDLDGFKLVNDTYGHAAGDELLRQVAFRIRSCLRAPEFAARIGGDEFVILQPGAPQPGAAFDLARRVVASLTEGFCLEQGNAQVGTSIGIAFHPRDAQGSDGLLKKADLALYQAKRNGRGRFHRFEEGMGQDLDEKHQIERDLRQAQARGELSLAYQPIFGSDGRLVCCEALLRWTHPTLGAISPARFVPVAEERGLIVALGDWVLREACREAAGWPADCRVAVNLSPLQVVLPDMPGRIAEILAETGLRPERLELEMTENLLLQDEDAAFSALNAFRALGVRLVLDDFGTGYANLSYLRRLPFGKLKIDRMFVGELETDTRSQRIVQAVLALSRELGLDVTAEGVETEGQLELLRSYGCGEVQGFLLGRPAAQGETRDLVQAASVDGSRSRLGAEETASSGPHDDPTQAVHRLQERIHEFAIGFAPMPATEPAAEPEIASSTDPRRVNG